MVWGMSSFDESPQPDSEAVYEVPIEDAFDLHPYRPADVLRMLDAYLDAALEQGFCEVRLIHGKGKGVQRAQVQVVQPLLREGGHARRRGALRGMIERGDTTKISLQFAVKQNGMKILLLQ